MKKRALLVIPFCLCSIGLLVLLSPDPNVAQAQGQSDLSWLLNSPIRNLLSASGEMKLLIQAGLLPGGSMPEPAPTPSIQVACPSGTDCQVNDSSTDVSIPCPGAANAGDCSTQSETTITVSPNGSNIVVGYNDSMGRFFSPIRLTGFASSSDGGANFTDRGNLSAGSNSDFGDPVVASDPQNSSIFYFADLSSSIGGITVHKSTDGGVTFSTGVDGTGFSGIFPDKEWLACGICRSGKLSGTTIVYVSYSEFAFGPSLGLTHSTDGGATFSGPIFASDPNGIQGSVIAVDNATGLVYVARESFPPPVPNNEIRISASQDCGASFGGKQTGHGKPRPLPDGALVGITNPIGNSIQCGRPVIRTNTGKDVRVGEFPTMAVDPTRRNADGNAAVYVAWASAKSATFGTSDADILFSRSTDLGITWSAPVKVNAGGAGNDGEQFFPTVNLTSDGNVHIVYYSLRQNVQLGCPDPDGCIDVVEATSTDGGLTWPSGLQTVINSLTFPVDQTNPNFNPGIAGCYMGDYIHSASSSSGTTRHYAWGDNRNTVFTTSFPTGRKDPDVRYRKVP